MLMLIHHLRGRTSEWCLPSHHHPERYSKRVQIRTDVHAKSGELLRTSLNFSQVFKLVRTKYVHNIHRRRYVMTSFTLDPLHSEISWVRGLFSELPRFFGD